MKTVNRREVAKFTAGEFERRVERARRLMTEEKLDGIMVTSEPNLEYLSGFVTQFAWASPTRPWYFVLPRVGAAVAIIPEIGETNWRATSWCKSRRWARRRSKRSIAQSATSAQSIPR